MKLVITMSRRFGTGASIIAEELSKRLDIPVYDKVMALYEEITRLIQNHVITAAYVLDGKGVVPALSKMAFGNMLGVTVNQELKGQELFGRENGNLIVKLVNLLPVETTVGLSNLKIQGSVIKRTVLRGTPSDKKAVPVSDRWIPDGNKIILPAYSFVVLELIPPFAT